MFPIGTIQVPGSDNVFPKGSIQVLGSDNMLPIGTIQVPGSGFLKSSFCYIRCIFYALSGASIRIGLCILQPGSY
ncbi:hypothetical protein DPMN_037430 [Dreissena polymorpha]|uniref:Uncharacterized protein n=1 Tax=Dreissena polymorpha TaxID=45954 RepID=A0A9D4MCM7_DREPO|nr:hypothetical protein DPMN_037430 [Dreissena polymorpha]